MDMAASLGLRLVLSSQTGSLKQSFRHSVLVVFSVLHAIVNFAW